MNKQDSVPRLTYTIIPGKLTDIQNRRRKEVYHVDDSERNKDVTDVGVHADFRIGAGISETKKFKIKKVKATLAGN